MAAGFVRSTIRHFIFQSVRFVRHRFLLVACGIFILWMLWTSTDSSSKTLDVFTGDGDTLCVTVLSAPTSSEQRDTARETWMKLDDGVKVWFVVGTLNLTDVVRDELNSERKKHGDLIMLPMIDSYQNLTLKLLETIKYIVKRENCKFILKADDDSFIRIDHLVSELEQVKIETWLYWGYFTGRAPVFKSGKWAEKDWFLCDKYLPYARGGGYIFSIGIAKVIAQMADILQKYGSEDVSFGAWTAPLKLHRVHDLRFDTEYKSRGCLNTYLITHKQSMEEMRAKMRVFRSTGTICPNGEQEHVKPYIYNWTLPASQCCQTRV